MSASLQVHPTPLEEGGRMLSMIDGGRNNSEDPESITTVCWKPGGVNGIVKPSEVFDIDV